MTILVLGGTGAMGTDIVRLLDRDNNNVIVTSRKHRESASDRVHYVQGNAKDIDFLRQLLRENYDVVIDFMVYTLDEFSDRYQMLLDHTVQYIFISSARVYADAGENEISEDFPRLLDVCEDEEYLATNEYALVKARQENILLKSGRCNWTIVRPSLTYSEDRLQLGVYEKENWLYRALNGRSIIFSEDLLERYYTLTYGHDVAEGIVALIGKPKAIGETFHIVQGTASKWRDVLDTYLDVFERVTGIHPKVVFTQKCTNLDIPGSQYQVIYGRYFNRHFDTSKMDTIIDSGSWLNPQEGLAKCLTAFLQNPEFRPINWQVEAYIDRAAKEITPLSEIATRKEQAQYLCYRYGFEGIYDILRNVKNNCGRLAGKVEMMKDLILGRGGVNYELIFGTGASAAKDYGGMKKVILTALQCGIRAFDTAPSYGTEQQLGQLLYEGIEQLGLTREALHIQTKIDPWQMQEGNIRKHIESALNKMNVSWLDALLIHWPVPEYFNSAWDELLSAKADGLVKKVGVCNLRTRHLKEMFLRTVQPEILQIERNPLRTCERELDLCRQYGIEVQAYSPLCKMDDRILHSELLEKIAQKNNKNIGQVVLKWQILTGAIPIFTTKKIQRIYEYTYLSDFSLTNEEIRCITAMNQNYKMYLECCICPGF